MGLEDHTPTHDTDIRLSAEQQEVINELVQELREDQPKLVIDLCTQAGISWDSRGFPDNRSVSEMEALALFRMKAYVAIQIGKMVHHTWTTEEIVRVVSQVSTVEQVPDAVLKHINSKRLNAIE